MNDIDTINRQNAEAIQRAIPDLRARGNHVVAEYSGLHFIGTHTFRGDTAEGAAAERAAARAAEINARNDGSSARVLAPTAEPVAESATTGV